jgi:hypothetical protein
MIFFSWFRNKSKIRASKQQSIDFVEEQRAIAGRRFDRALENHNAILKDAFGAVLNRGKNFNADTK